MKAPVRLSLFHPAFEAIGGAELLALHQAQFFRAQLLPVKIVTLAFDAKLWAARMNGVPVELVTKRHWTDGLTGWTRLAKLRRRARRAGHALSDATTIIAYNFPAEAMLGAAQVPGFKIWQCNEPPRALHLREGNPALTARALGDTQGPELATARFRKQLEAYDQALGDRRGIWSRREFDLQAVQRLDLVYAISEFSRDNARRLYGKCREEVIYPIVRFPAGGRSRTGLDRDGLKVLVHSRLEVLKNIDAAFRGFRVFRDEVNPSAELHVVGDGPFRAELEAEVGKLGLEGVVRFHGYLPSSQLDAVYQACDVLVLLTLDEPFGMVFPEAAAKGLLLVGPDHGGPLEILDDGRFGWNVDPFSPEALAEALAEIWALSDSEVEARRADADRACRSRFGVETIGPQLMALLEQS